MTTDSAGAPVRLAVITDAVAPWSTGGKERRQHELWTRLAARGHRVDVYTMRWWGDGDETELDGVVFHGICPALPLYTGGRRSIRQALVFALCSLRVAVARGFDVLEADAIPFLPLFPARIVAWLRRRPLVVTWHEYWGRAYWVRYLGPAGLLAAAVERLAVALPDRVVAASEATAQRLRPILGTDRVDVVTPGILARREARVESPPFAAARPLELITAARLLDHKRVDVAIGAVAQLAADGVDARLTVIGDGPEAGSLRELAARLEVSQRVSFLPFLPTHGDVLDRFAAADLLVFPSEREGFGMVALESMAAGTPVVTSTHPDNHARHLVVAGVNGDLAAAEPVAIAAAVRRCLPRLAELGREARRAAADYDWDRIADRAEAAYRAATDRSAAQQLTHRVVGGLAMPVDVEQPEVIG